MSQVTFGDFQGSEQPIGGQLPRKRRKCCKRTTSSLCYPSHGFGDVCRHLNTLWIVRWRTKVSLLRLKPPRATVLMSFALRDMDVFRCTPGRCPSCNFCVWMRVDIIAIWCLHVFFFFFFYLFSVRNADCQQSNKFCCLYSCSSIVYFLFVRQREDCPTLVSKRLCICSLSLRDEGRLSPHLTWCWTSTSVSQTFYNLQHLKNRCQSASTQIIFP